ncbi:sporulation inhibitor of replication protein SirA [Virgibacillus ainsalahensis]
MYEYSVFWIREQIAKNYFYKSDILYRFINDYQHNQNRTDLKRQFNYITHNFSQHNIISYIKRYYSDTNKVQITKSQIEIIEGNKLITLHVSKKHIKFSCETLQDAEDLLFPMLRSLQPILFIVGVNIENFGWISPVQRVSKSQDEQVLYSYL